MTQIWAIKHHICLEKIFCVGPVLHKFNIYLVSESKVGTTAESLWKEWRVKFRATNHHVPLLLTGKKLKFQNLTYKYQCMSCLHYLLR